jgi:hypothetical protein
MFKFLSRAARPSSLFEGCAFVSLMFFRGFPYPSIKTENQYLSTLRHEYNCSLFEGCAFVSLMFFRGFPYPSIKTENQYHSTLRHEYNCSLFEGCAFVSLMFFRGFPYPSIKKNKYPSTLRPGYWLPSLTALYVSDNIENS